MLLIHLRAKALLEKNAVLQSPSRIEELVKIFIHATNVSFPPFPGCEYVLILIFG